MKFEYKKRPPVLIANRGEIAIRVARTAKMLGFPTVAVYSDADRFSEHVKFCDQAVHIGGSEPKLSYLLGEKIIEAARRTGARYIHPGYGFLSERAHFVEACEKAGLVFVGPSADSMRVMGDKIEARATVDRLKMPRVPGSPGAVKDAKEAAEFAERVKYPVLLKATAGGGGKGMRRVDSAAEIAAAFESASREALTAFGDGAMYVEKYILEPHHVEIQVFGDGKGGAVHLGERECSIQRRHQKVWEESPAPILEQYPETRGKMFEAAIKVASGIKYAGAGTFEFIVDGAGDFYFLEMNTRLQVEHPVTEWVTGVDLVAWQLLLAAGELKLPSQDSITRTGASVEVRIYAEDPQTFLPAPGKMGRIVQPNGPFLRWDSSYETATTNAGEVSMFYDPMIAKLSVWGQSRDEAVARMRVALDELSIEAPKSASGDVKGSLKTNVVFLQRLTRTPDVLKGNTTTDLIPRNEALVLDPAADASEEMAIALSLLRLTEGAEDATALEGGAVRGSLWSQTARLEGRK
ncbi:MAG: ATP-grasp domain-containing protein [Bdellovibrionales bacterium]|nr:ATP-grasp domain-containing protein [Bdellovibrionales bacterium]